MKNDVIYNNQMEFYYNHVSSLAKYMLYHVNQCGHFYCTNKFMLHDNNYSMYDILYVIDGSGLIGNTQREFPIKKGDLVLVDTTRPHFSATDEFLDFYWIHFNGPSCEEICRLIDQFDANVIANVSLADAQKNLIDIVIKQRQNKPLSDSEVSVKVHTMLCDFIKNTEANTDIENDKVINKAISFIRANSKKSITLEKIAASVNLSTFHFSRIFKKSVGYSPHEFLVITRINTAKVLLVTTNMLIKEIAIDTGFSSEARFIVSFKNVMGMTPSEFRKLQA